MTRRLLTLLPPCDPFVVYIIRINQSVCSPLLSSKRDQSISVHFFRVTIPICGLIITYLWHTCDVHYLWHVWCTLLVTSMWCTLLVTNLWPYCNTLVIHLWPYCDPFCDQSVTHLWPYCYLLVTVYARNSFQNCVKFSLK